MTGKKKRFLAIGLVLLLVAGGLCGKRVWDWEYEHYLRPRENEFFLTYEPFSRKLFDIDPDSVDGIYAKLERPSEDVNRRSYKSQEDIRAIADYLNSFRYTFWIPGPEERQLPSGYWRPTILVDRYPPTDPRYSVYDDVGVELEENRFGIFFHTQLVYFYGSKEYFAGLWELLTG